MTRVLAIRFSSMGDVLLTAPVLKGVINNFNDAEFFLLTKKQFQGYFNSIEGLKVIGADTYGTHKGIRGLTSLSKYIKNEIRPDILIDLHSVPRSWYLSFISAFRIPVYRIDKGRKEKKDYIEGRVHDPLTHTVERYTGAFEKAGFAAAAVRYPFIEKRKERKLRKGSKANIGLSPFARHRPKTWPFSYTMELMRILSVEFDASFHFYGGKEEYEFLGQHDFGDLNVIVHSGRLSPDEEINSISRLDFFISMDSGNMHLADLAGIRVFSIWGATHPDLGFRPLNQPSGHIIETDQALECRPCSVYGNKECRLKDSKYKCLLDLSPEYAAGKILSSIFV